MCPADERRRYIVTSSPIGWVQTQNYPWALQTNLDKYLSTEGHVISDCEKLIRQQKDDCLLIYKKVSPEGELCDTFEFPSGADEVEPFKSFK